MNTCRLAGARIMGLQRQAATGIPVDVRSSSSTGPGHQSQVLPGAAAMAQYQGLPK